MLLHKLILNFRNPGVRRDLASPYELHSTLCRLFSAGEEKSAPGSILWRLENSQNSCVSPQLLVQSFIKPDWSKVLLTKWLAKLPDEPLDLMARLSLENLHPGQRFRFRLRANPCVFREGKRQGLLRTVDQEAWLARKGVSHGFELPRLSSFTMDEEERIDVMISQEQMLRSKQRKGNEIRIYSVQYDGVLTVTDVEKFLAAIKSGIGHGKMMGLGLFSVVPLR